MKIAHLISHYPLPFVGGAEACVHSLAKEQTKKGHMVKVIAPIESELPLLNYEVLPLRLRLGSVYTTLPPIINSSFLKQLKFYQERFRFDIWQVTMGFPFAIAAAAFFKKNNLPYVIRCSGEDIQIEPEIKYGKRCNPIWNYLIKRYYSESDGLISIVDSITENYLNIGVPSNKIYYLRNGVNKRLFNIEVDKRDIKRSWGAAPDKKLILTVGKYRQKKGFHYIPDIIKVLSKDRNDFVWLLIGHDNEVIRKEAQDKGVGQFLMINEIRSRIDENGELLFPDKRVAQLYKSADIFVFPSLIEGCSNVITEAMAAGLPVVSTDVQGVRDIVENEKTGLLSKRGSPEVMAENIERLLNDMALYKRIRENALKETEGLDWTIVAGRYIDVYKKVIKQKRG